MYSFSDIADPPDTNGHMLANIISISCLRYYGRGVPRFSRSILHFPEFDSSQPIGSTVTLIDAEMRRAEGGGRLGGIERLEQVVHVLSCEPAACIGNLELYPVTASGLVAEFAVFVEMMNRRYVDGQRA